MEVKNAVLAFIGRFVRREKYGEVTEVFKNGCCYWYAKILQLRFYDHNAFIVYDEVENHFGTQIGDEVYDISGCVTEKYNWRSWSKYPDDDAHRKRIERDCIMF